MKFNACIISASLVEANETNAPNLKRCKNFGSIFFNYIHLLSKTCCTVVKTINILRSAFYYTFISHILNYLWL